MIFTNKNQNKGCTMVNKNKKIINSLTPEEIKDYFYPLEGDFQSVAKVISYVAQIPLCDINDTSIYYSKVKDSLSKNGFPSESRYYPVFTTHLKQARDYFCE
jgi:hypothetical protein